MFDNAWSYNRKTSRVYRYCTKLSEVFEANINDAMQSLGYCCGHRVGIVIMQRWTIGGGGPCHHFLAINNACWLGEGFQLYMLKDFTKEQLVLCSMCILACVYHVTILHACPPCVCTTTS